MKKFIGRLLGYDKRLAEVEAQRDANRELAMKYAQESADMKIRAFHSKSGKPDRTCEAAALIRRARHTMNLKRSGITSAQAQLTEALSILEGGETGGD